MTLPPKAINALVRFKEGLTKGGAPDEPEQPSAPELELGVHRASKSETSASPSVIITHQTMRHARRLTAFQRGCQRKDFWAPIY